MDVIKCPHQYLKKVKEEVELPHSCPLGINRRDGKPGCTQAFCGRRKMNLTSYEYYCDLDKERCVVFLGTKEGEKVYRENIDKLGTIDWKDNQGEVRFKKN